MNTTIFLIRHGEVYNPKRIVYGRTINVQLSKEGIDQMMALGDYLKNQGVVPSVIMTSPLARTKQSAQEIAKAYGNVAIIENEDLQEIDEFELVGRSVDWIESIDVYNYKGPELEGVAIESPENQAKRIIKAIENILHEHKGKTVFVISHGDPTAFAMWKLLNPNLENFPSITELKKYSYLKKGEAWRIVFNDKGRVLEHELMSLDESLKGEREY